MKNNTNINFIIYSFLIFHMESVFSLQLGSERFQDFTQGTPDYGILVDMGNNPEISSNMYFTDNDFVSGIAPHAFPNGSGEKYFVANMMNFQGNYVMAGAKSDPRSSAFIMNSMDRLLTDPQAEIELAEGLTASKLSAAQAGENAQRYIVPEIITPEVGYYQTADNQQSFESAYENVLLGQAEESLFKGDESDSIAYFQEKVANYKESEDKQNEARGYQRDGLMRSKKTAETFRDFFQMKASISDTNLQAMPTQESILNNCKANTPRGENLQAIYNSSMPQDEIAFYNFPPPQYDFDFCEQYLHNESSFLIRNRPVRTQLNTLVEDSTNMAEGLDEISRELSNRNLSLEDIANLLSNNEAWKTLAERSKAYKECGEKNCLAPAEKTLGGLVNFPGAENHHSPERKEIRKLLSMIKQSGKMPGEDSPFILALKEKKSSTNSLKRNGVNNLNSGDNTFAKARGLNDPQDQSDLEDRRERDLASVKIGDDNVYRGKRSPRGGGYFRGEKGVLRGPSGKPVQGYAAPHNVDLFEIISRRYHIKMLSQ